MKLCIQSDNMLTLPHTVLYHQRSFTVCIHTNSTEGNLSTYAGIMNLMSTYHIFCNDVQSGPNFSVETQYQQAINTCMLTTLQS